MNIVDDHIFDYLVDYQMTKKNVLLISRSVQNQTIMTRIYHISLRSGLDLRCSGRNVVECRERCL